MSIRRRMWSLCLVALPGAAAFGQSSSLYVDPIVVPPPPPPPGMVAPPPPRMAPALIESSFTSVRMPEPRQFAVHDLVTIIVREESEAKSSAELETEKELELDGKVDAFPDLQLKKLLNLMLTPSTSIAQNPVELGVDMSREWTGEGKYSRRDSMTSRVTAQIIDVKPNGLLVLEARKYIKNDNEELDLVLTGVCRAEDVSIDNTVLSTQLHDLNVVKEHKGELRKTTKKGLITKVLEALFSF